MIFWLKRALKHLEQWLEDPPTPSASDVVKCQGGRSQAKETPQRPEGKPNPRAGARAAVLWEAPQDPGRGPQALSSGRQAPESRRFPGLNLI